MGSVIEMDTLLVNHEDGNGGRIDTPINFNDGTYELHSNGRGQLHISLGDSSGAASWAPVHVGSQFTRCIC